jgi:hypothetical protein
MDPLSFLKQAEDLEKQVQSEPNFWVREQLRAKIRAHVNSYLRFQNIELKTYPLPIRDGRWEITQGNTTTGSHKGETNRFCWDFELIDKNKDFDPDHGREHKIDPDNNYCMWKPFYAIDSGRISYYFRDKSDLDTENMIIIKHRETPESDYDGTRAIYCHMPDGGFAGIDNFDELAKKYEGKYYYPGHDVKQGDLIGYIGWTGTYYAHLHFSMKYKGIGQYDNLSLPIEFEKFYYPMGIKRENTYPIWGDVISYSRTEAIHPSIP